MVGRRHITEDILVDILLRLPVESLVRFKRVSKHWYTLITSPTFIAKHFHHEQNHARLLIGNWTMSYDSISSVAFSLFPNKIVPGVPPEEKIIHQLHRVTDYKSIIGPVDGLFLVEKSVCFDEEDVHLALWNPATRGFWPLPPLSFEHRPVFKDHEDQLALGFDPLTRDYKVLCIQQFWDDWMQLGVPPRCFVRVYSLRNNSWKNLRPELPYLCSLHDSMGATYLNGLYYWLAGRLNDKFYICSFKMGTEQFGEMQGPDINPKANWGMLMLRGDSLGMLVSDDPGKPMTCIYDVWVMNQEGSWSKAVTIQPVIPAHFPYGVWEDDKMIFGIPETSQLVLYDSTTGQLADLGFQLDILMSRCWVFSYKESLVPIKSGNDGQGNDNAVRQIDHFFSVLQRAFGRIGC